MSLHISSDVNIQITGFAIYATGDPYVGSRSEDIDRKNKRIAELELENSKLKAQVKALEPRYDRQLCSGDS